MSAPETSNQATPQPTIILTGPGHLSSVVREAEEALNALGKFFIDCRHESYSIAIARFCGRELVVKIGNNSYFRVTPETILLALDSAVEFRSSLTNRRVAVPKKLPEQILRRSRYESHDQPFPELLEEKR